MNQKLIKYYISSAKAKRGFVMDHDMKYFIFEIDWSQTDKSKVIVKAKSHQEAERFLNVKHHNKDTWLPYINYHGVAEALIEV